MAQTHSKRFSELLEHLRVAPGTKVNLARDRDPSFRAGWLDKKESAEDLRESVELLASYQDRLAAQDVHGVLVVLQGIDASGKDGTVRHVMSGVNPQGVSVHSFKLPSTDELEHDFLWRYAAHVPARGEIAIFNRSHYEEVLVVRVHPELLERQRLPEAARGGEVWHNRYREINDWERHLAGNGFAVVKLFLHISREEQRRRFLKRIDLPEKNWKFSSADVAERGWWEDYERAFSEMLTHTSTPWAPWYVIPADHKWFARIAVGAVLVHTLAEIDPRYPSGDAKQREELEHARRQLELEAPDGAPTDPEAARGDAARGD